MGNDMNPTDKEIRDHLQAHGALVTENGVAAVRVALGKWGNAAPVAAQVQQPACDAVQNDRNWIQGPYVTDTMGSGWCVRIDGTDIFADLNRYGCKGRVTFQIAEGLGSKEEAEAALSDWLRKSDPVAAQAHSEVMPISVSEAMEAARWRNALVGLCDTDRIDTPEQAVVNVKRRMRRMGLADQAQQPVSGADGLPSVSPQHLAALQISGNDLHVSGWNFDCHGRAFNQFQYARAAAMYILRHIADEEARTKPSIFQPKPSGNAGELPPLPKGYVIQMTPDPDSTPAEWFDETDMRDYARAALAAQGGGQDRLSTLIHSMFQSGNSIPVDRITLTRTQYEQAIK